MFSVPGWNLSAPLATQIAKPKPKNPDHEGKKSKKRKRKRELAEQEQVNDDNIDELWGKVVEGKEGDKKQADTPTVEDAALVKQDGIATSDAATDELRGKKRRKKDKKGKKLDGVKAPDGVDGPEQGTVAAVEAVAEAPPTQTEAPESRASKKKQKRDNQDAASTTNGQTSADTSTAAVLPLVPIPAPKPTANLTPLQRSMRQKLTSARFRHLNESLYTKPSKESLSIFADSPEMFEDYHAGFAQQVTTWPENPVDSYFNEILRRGKVRNKDPWKEKKRQGKKGKGKGQDKQDAETAPPDPSIKPLPRNMKFHSTIADLGCGTASLSSRLQPHLRTLNMSIHSFDLSKPADPATAPLVTVSDISALPLPDGLIDVAIFCLALMGTNWLDFVDEAWRVLRWRGELWVSEIKSRFGRVERKRGAPPINSVGSLRKPDAKAKGKAKPKKGGKGGEKEEDEGIQDSSDEAELAQQVDGAARGEGTDVSAFVEVLKKRGFVLDALPERPSDAIDLSNKMFVKMRFVKAGQPVKGKNFKEGESGGKLGMGDKGKKFAVISRDEDDEGGDEKDAKVLKPCLYKIR
jgi:ribosomal RNA-processing protein 8